MLQCILVANQLEVKQQHADMAGAPGSSAAGRVLRFKGHRSFRQRLLLAVLSQRSIHISEIRSNADSPGVSDFEVSFLRLLERVTNGTTVEINYTGTEVLVRPGLVAGGTVVHTCPDSRGVGWFLEPLLVLGLFGKQELRLTLKGVTSNARDVSVSASLRACERERAGEPCSCVAVITDLLLLLLLYSLLLLDFLLYFHPATIHDICFNHALRTPTGRHTPYLVPASPLHLSPSLSDPTTRAPNPKAWSSPLWGR